MSDVLGPLAILALGVWIYLTLFHGRFWNGAPLLDSDRPPSRWPRVTAVVPARNEADCIGLAVRSLLDQDYPGPLRVVVVDDRSEDGTGRAVRRALRPDEADRMTVRLGQPLPLGWTGKLWAMHQGVTEAEKAAAPPDHILFADADIAHHPTALRRLVAKAEAGRLDLVSLMVLLRTDGTWARLLIPAFVFFFQKLYPFPRVNDPARRTAAAAGGCMLVRRAALQRAGGLAPIRGALIDDCALAALLKAGGRGRLWLGLTDETWSVRPYAGLGGIWDMVARTAYTQLHHSPALLVATLGGMTLTYLVAPLAALYGALAGDGDLLVVGATAWLLMALCFQPTLHLYRQSPLLGLLLPVAGALYAAMTLDSARRHRKGRGGAWKGRTYAAPSS